MARSAAAAFGAVPDLARPPSAHPPALETDHPLAAPEWTMPAAPAALLTLAVLAASAVLAILQ